MCLKVSRINHSIRVYLLCFQYGNKQSFLLRRHSFNRLLLFAAFLVCASSNNNTQVLYTYRRKGNLNVIECRVGPQPGRCHFFPIKLNSSKELRSFSNSICFYFFIIFSYTIVYTLVQDQYINHLMIVIQRKCIIKPYHYFKVFITPCNLKCCKS